MNKLIFFGALACTLFLIAGSYLFPGDIIMWFAGTSLNYTIFRVAVIVALAVALVTNPPRRIYMRIGMGIFSLVLLGLGANLLLADSLHILDAVLFMILSVSFAIEALEFSEDELIQRTVAIHERHTKLVEESRQRRTRQPVFTTASFELSRTPWRYFMSSPFIESGDNTP